MTEKQIRALVGPNVPIEKGNARGEWVVDSTACWSLDDVRRAVPSAMAYVSDDPLFKSLTAREVTQFQKYARITEPNLAQWDICHPVCRAEWVRLGKGPKGAA